MPARPATRLFVTRDPRRVALAAVGFTVLTWGCSNVAIKAVPLPGAVASFYRLWLAVPFLWAVCLASPGTRAALHGEWARAALVGGVLFGIHQLLFFTSLKLTSVANVSIIGALQPALVLLVAGRLFGESPGRLAVLWAGVAVVGTILVVVGSAGTPAWSPFGDLVAVLNLLAFTTYFLASKGFRNRIGATEYVTGMTTVAAVVVSIACLATGQDLSAPHGVDWLVLLALALIPGTLGHFLTNWAHPHAPAFLISILLLAVPVVAAIGAVIVLGEHLVPLQILGGAVVLGAIARIVASLRPENREEIALGAAETDAP